MLVLLADDFELPSTGDTPAIDGSRALALNRASNWEASCPASSSLSVVLLPLSSLSLRLDVEFVRIGEPRADPWLLLRDVFDTAFESLLFPFFFP